MPDAGQRLGGVRSPVEGRLAPLTCQFVLEDHAVRHSFHHLARIKGAVAARLSAA